MKNKGLLLILIVLCLAGCTSTANDISIIRTSYGTIAFTQMIKEVKIMSDSITGTVEIIQRPFAHLRLHQVTYSQDKRYMVGLSTINDLLRTKMNARPPALVDLQTGEFKQCKGFGDVTSSYAYYGLKDGHHWGIGATSNLIYVFDFSTCEIVENIIEIDETNLIMGLSWNPEARLLAYGVHISRDFTEEHQDSELYLYDFDNETTTIIAEWFSPSWSPDGNKIAFFSEGGFSVIDLEVNGITAVDMEYRSINDGSVHWSADGNGFLFCVYMKNNEGRSDEKIYYYSINDNELELLLIGGIDPYWIYE